jgi:hypothetical protein
MSAQITPFTGNYPSGKILKIVAPATVTSGTDRYTFTKWEDNSTNPTRQITVAANTTLSMTYTIVPKYNLTVIAGVGGTTIPAAGTYVYWLGESPSITATPGADYDFAYWIVNGVAQPTLTNPTYSFAISANISVQPYFVAKAINLTIAAGANGTVTLPDATIVAAGTSVTRAVYIGTTYNFTANPSTTYPGYILGSWTLAGTSQGATNPLALRITASMNGQTLAAVFAKNTDPQITMTVAKVGTGTVNPYGSTTVTLSTQTVNTTFTATDVSGSGQTFNHWELQIVGQSLQTFSTTALTLPVTAAYQGATLTAVFTAVIYTVTVNSTPLVGIPITITEMN